MSEKGVTWPTPPGDVKWPAPTGVMSSEAWDQYVAECGLEAMKAALQHSSCKLASECAQCDYASLMTSWMTHEGPLPARLPSFHWHKCDKAEEDAACLSRWRGGG